MGMVYAIDFPPTKSGLVVLCLKLRILNSVHRARGFSKGLMR